MFILIWKGEEIDQFDTRAEAEAMRNEYNIAYGGGVTVEYSEEDDGQPSWEQEWEDFGEDGGYEMEYI
jgi:hypothetical protein